MSARSLNKVMLIGNLGGKPITRSTNSGTTVANFDVATNEEWKNKDGVLQKKTEWHKIVVWRKLAEICSQFLDKGRKVYIEGRLQTNKWTDNNGNERFTTEIVADQIIFLDNGNTYKDNYDGGPVEEDRGGPVDATNSYSDEDDVPF